MSEENELRLFQWVKLDFSPYNFMGIKIQHAFRLG
jgi:hypothetical protein